MQRVMQTSTCGGYVRRRPPPPSRLHPPPACTPALATHCTRLAEPLPGFSLLPLSSFFTLLLSSLLAPPTLPLPLPPPLCFVS